MLCLVIIDKSMKYILKGSRARQWLLSVLFLFAVMPVSFAAGDTAALLDTLDNVLRNSRQYVDARRAVISKLKASLASAADDEERYRLTSRLREEYRSFDIDSALYYANEKMAVARRIGNGSYINDARMNIAEMNGVYGMYKEALDYIDRVDKSVLDVYQIEYYYHVYRNIYGLMADNCGNAGMKKHYQEQTDKYRDSILFVNTPESFNYLIVKADKDNVHGRYGDAVKALNEAYSKFGNIHDKALIDYSLAMSYAGMGDMENSRRHLVLSAINDIRSGIREYTSLRMLATQLYNDGECAARFRKVTAPFMMRRMKTDKSIIADLPDKIELDDYAALTSEQAALYHRTLEAAMAEIEGLDTTSHESLFKRQGLILQMILALKQICNHPAQFLKNGDARIELSGKAEMLLDRLEGIVANGEKVLVFTQFREMGDLLVRFIEERLGQRPLFYHGGCSVKQRQEMVERFQSLRSDKVFILSLKAAGTGLNLTAASHVIHYDLWWNPAVEAQATDRAYRIGQQRNVMVHRFITKDTFEERINDMIQQKKHLADMTVASGESWIGQLRTHELREIFG